MTHDPSHPPAPHLSPQEEAARVDAIKRDHERRHFIFATIVVMGCMLALPVLGALYVLFVRWGWLASPVAR